MLKLVCDRCDEELSAEIRGITNPPSPYANAAWPAELGAEVILPSEWTQVDGRHLCKRCSMQLRDFLRPESWSRGGVKFEEGK